VDAASLSVVGIAEVLSHIPRIYGEYRRLIAAARAEAPDLAILTDSPDFHLRLARHLKAMGVPVLYLVAPQVWAWRKGRIRQIRRNIDRLLCIFPFEEEYFRSRGVAADFIGHPLAGMVRPSCGREEFFSQQGLRAGPPVVALLPGSRRGEAARHLPVLGDAVRHLAAGRDVQFLLAVPAGVWTESRAELGRWVAGLPVKVVEGRTWDAIAHADLALAASGTVTVETALLGTPMVTFYRVSPVTWLAKPLVDVPFYSMVNLIAGRAVVPELIQNEMSAERLAGEAARLLDDQTAREAMRRELAVVAGRLRGSWDPMEKAAAAVSEMLNMEGGV
jgi:lipid-A-disaccharide synthase